MVIPVVVMIVETMNAAALSLNHAAAKQNEEERKEVLNCTAKCTATCIRPDRGGPLSVRKEVVVFKEGFRDRNYCLSECKDVCSLSRGKIG